MRRAIFLAKNISILTGMSQFADFETRPNFMLKKLKSKQLYSNVHLHMKKGYFGPKGHSILPLTLHFLAILFCFHMYIQKKSKNSCHSSKDIVIFLTMSRFIICASEWLETCQSGKFSVYNFISFLPSLSKLHLN